jgi:hypothetical protein
MAEVKAALDWDSQFLPSDLSTVATTVRLSEGVEEVTAVVSPNAGVSFTKVHVRRRVTAHLTARIINWLVDIPNPPPGEPPPSPP